jgi:serine/threonine protein kinase
MATVYLAQDVKHDRKVALKVLHPELAATPGTDVQELHSGPVHRTEQSRSRLTELRATS